MPKIPPITWFSFYYDKRLFSITYHNYPYFIGGKNEIYIKMQVRHLKNPNDSNIQDYN